MSTDAGISADTSKANSNAALVLFLLSALNKNWLTIHHDATTGLYVEPKGWTYKDIPGAVYTAEGVQNILTKMATTGIVNGQSPTSTLNDDGTMGPGSMLDTLRAAWGVFHWLGRQPTAAPGSQGPYDPGSTECITDITLITGLHY